MELADVKRNLNKPVWYGGNQYLLTGCILRRGEEGFYYQTELYEQQARAVLICRLEDISDDQNTGV